MVELKNDLQLTGVLHSVDQFLNIKLDQVSVADPDKCPHLVSIGYVSRFRVSGWYA